MVVFKNLFKKFLKKQEKTLNWEGNQYQLSFKYYVEEKLYLTKDKDFKDTNVQKVYQFVKGTIKNLYNSKPLSDKDNIDYKKYYVIIDANKKCEISNWTVDYITILIKDNNWKEINYLNIEYNSIPCWNEVGMNTIETLWNAHATTIYTKNTYLMFLSYFLDKLNDKWKVDFPLLVRILSMMKNREDVENNYNNEKNLI